MDKVVGRNNNNNTASKSCLVSNFNTIGEEHVTRNTNTMTRMKMREKGLNNNDDCMFYFTLFDLNKRKIVKKINKIIQK